MAAPVITLLTDDPSTANSNPYNASEVDPNDGDVLALAASSTSGLSGARDGEVSDNLGGTWIRSIKSTGTAGNVLVEHWVREQESDGSPIIITYDSNASSPTGCSLQIFSVSGGNGPGSAAFDASGPHDNIGSGATPAPVLSDNPLSTSTILTSVAVASQTSPTEPSGYTATPGVPYGSPNASLKSAYDDGNTGATITWGGTTAGGGAGVATEFIEPVSTDPTATTQAATGVTDTSATLNGEIDPNGTATDYQFEYGLTTGYGTEVPASPGSVGSGTSPVAVDDPITGLDPDTTYHFRIVALRGSTPYNGADQTFTTDEETPPPSGSGGGGSSYGGSAYGGTYYGGSFIVVDSGDTTAPVPNVTAGPTVARISRVSGKDSFEFTWQADEAYQAYEVRSVPAADSLHTAGQLIESGGSGAASTPVVTTITDDELVAADPGDETKIIKVFVQDLAGNWSV